MLRIEDKRLWQRALALTKENAARFRFARPYVAADSSAGRCPRPTLVCESSKGGHIRNLPPYRHYAPSQYFIPPYGHFSAKKGRPHYRGPFHTIPIGDEILTPHNNKTTESVAIQTVPHDKRPRFQKIRQYQYQYQT